MCQICEKQYKFVEFGNNNCHITIADDEYRFVMNIDKHQSYSTPIKCCPFCGNKFKTPETRKTDSVKFDNIIDYIKSLDTEKTYDKWRYAHDLWVKYHKDGKNPDEHIDEFIAKVEKYK